jgi:hypothetical protein
MSGERFLKERGKAIWAAYGADELPEGSKAMVHELCRLADSLDKLDMILGARATEWAKIVDGIEGEVTLEVNGLLGERRQHALAFKVLYNELRAAGIKEATGNEAKETEGRGGLILSLVQDVG